MAEKILGLDIGVNSIGWCIISKNKDDKSGIVDGGVRILPSDGKQLSYYVEGRSLTNSSGQSISKAAIRRGSRSQRRYNKSLSFCPAQKNLSHLKRQAKKQSFYLK